MSVASKSSDITFDKGGSFTSFEGGTTTASSVGPATTSSARGPVERNNLYVSVQSGFPENGVLIFNVHIRFIHVLYCCVSIHL